MKKGEYKYLSFKQKQFLELVLIIAEKDNPDDRRNLRKGIIKILTNNSYDIHQQRFVNGEVKDYYKMKKEYGKIFSRTK